MYLEARSDGDMYIPFWACARLPDETSYSVVSGNLIKTRRFSVDRYFR